VGGPVPKQADAITLGRLIIVRRRSAEAPSFPHLLRHELTHVEQWHRLGYRRFVVDYLSQYLRGRLQRLTHHDAYLAITLEGEARRHADHPFVATIVGMPTTPITLEVVATAHRDLESFVAALTDDDLRKTSRLPNWTVGHVLAHMAMNARAFERVARQSMANSPSFMYDSIESRAADIETHSSSTAQQMLRIITESSSAMEDAWAQLLSRAGGIDQIAGHAATANGSPEFSLQEVLSRRLREVQVHSVDCGLRLRTVDGWSDTFVAADLPLQFATVSRRTSEPVHVVDEHGAHYATPTAESNDALHITRRQLLAWALDRAQPAGLPTLAPWGNQSAWTTP
jgi:maleylpyruvate isomerase